MYNLEKMSEVVSDCLRVRLPFALYSFPSESEFKIVSHAPDNEGNCVAHLDNEKWNGFAINFFGNDEPYVAGIEDSGAKAGVSAADSATCFPHPQVKPVLRSTPRMRYNAGLHNVISNLKKRGGKVVMSQLTAVVTARNITDVIADYFTRFPDTFRYLCYTPETGIWLGATPELLIDYDTASGRLSTMALAGTRSADAEGPWDKKNIDEHYMVVDFIGETLASIGMETEAHDLEELRFGNIVHLCTPLTAVGHASVSEILENLSPTPALCGLPRQEAIRDIVMNEYHERICYGGYIAVKTGSRIRAYANLRCAMVAPGYFCDSSDGWLYNLYSGGGITAMSKIDDEWNEAMAKCLPLLSAVTDDPAPTREDNCDITYFSILS